MIISASRRTDIPAFYSEWFINRLREGFVYVKNPMNANQISKIILSPDNVDCIVFWSKDPKNIIKYLSEIDNLGFKYYFQFTITPYGNDIEKNIRDKKSIIQTFKELSDRIGSEKIVLRYDPIFITENEKYSIDFHARAFKKLIDALSGYTDSVIISFLDDYQKVKNNMKDVHIKQISCAEMESIASVLSDIAHRAGLRIETCAEEIDLSKFGIAHAKCIDGERIEKIIGCPLFNKNKRDGNRDHCGCMQCIDIGQYNSCTHDCTYCYANINKSLALRNKSLHDPKSPLLFGSFEERNVKLRENGTKSFKTNQNEFEF